MVATLETEGRIEPLPTCLACGTERLNRYIDLGRQPLANDYHDGSRPLASFPLAVNVCTSCFHSQLSHAVDPSLLYENYLYVSGTTQTLLRFFDDFVDRAEAHHPGRCLRVLDIASNDGSLLSRFAARGHDVLGVDPAVNLAPLAAERGVATHVGYWNRDTAAELDRQFDVIIAMNVLAHVADPEAFLVACREALAPGGLLYIQTSQAEMVRRFEFDTVYHEHHSFFTGRSFRALARRTGLSIVEGGKVPVHGISYLWTLREGDAPETGLGHLLDEEERWGYYELGTYEQFGASVRATLDFVAETVAAHTAAGYRSIGYGAAAKGNTLLNAAGLRLDYVVDDNPLKHGLLTPGQDIPITAVDRLATDEAALCIVVLAWNFFDEVRSRILHARQHPRDVLVRYFPERHVVRAYAAGPA